MKLRKIYYSILKIKNRILYGRPVLVTMYHRTSNVFRDKLNHLTVDLDSFENQLHYFKENYQILRLSEEWDSLKKTGLVITFDDGYADNILNALPLLEKYQIPATIFVTTLNVNTENEFWWDRIVFDYSYCDTFFYFPGEQEKVSKASYSYDYIIGYLNKVSNNNKADWFLEFERLNSIPFKNQSEFRSLSNDELYRLSKHPLIDIGIHTHNHYSLGDLNYEEQKKELAYSIKKLNELTNKTIKYLALPHGSYNSETFIVMDELKIEGMLLANNYYSNRKNKLSKKINRILIPNIKSKALSQYMKLYDF